MPHLNKKGLDYERDRNCTGLVGNTEAEDLENDEMSTGRIENGTRCCQVRTCDVIAHLTPLGTAIKPYHGIAQQVTVFFTKKINLERAKLL